MAALRICPSGAGRGARCEIVTTTNARCFDFAHVERLGQDAAEAAKEKALIGYLRAMNVITTDTCINYQTLYQPHFESASRGVTQVP